jgi:beta-fructofuranosidase
MYTDLGFQRKNMGDVDVLWHDGLYHLFHLVLPNHDFIAHAVSRDAFNWRRVDNALFIGHPGGWDDDMLWTMHVTPDPHKPGGWRMFYTGLSRRDGGYVQRLGLAKSDDLYTWVKTPDRWARHDRRRGDLPSDNIRHGYDADSAWPLAAQEPWYEDSLDEGRQWVSFRDPYYYRDGEGPDARGMLLMAARVPDGPVIRRGCIGVAEEVAPDQFELREPLYHPRIYDDVEVPNLTKIGDTYFLLGSIREDVKVRYWYSKSLDGPWRNYFDNVLLPQGNYAARIGHDPGGPLVWNFFSRDLVGKTTRNLMPPPKRVVISDDGRLKLKPFEGFDQQVTATKSCGELMPLAPMVGNPHARVEDEGDGCFAIDSDGGFEAFLLAEPVDCFRLSGRLHLDGRGKCGFVFRTNPDTSDGYHLSLDLIKGVAQLRSWGARHDGRDEHAFQFEALQSGFWLSDPAGPWDFELLAFGSYLELVINGFVLLTLADDSFAAGRVGLYVETARLKVENLTLNHLRTPRRPSEQLAEG